MRKQKMQVFLASTKNEYLSILVQTNIKPYFCKKIDAK